MYFDATNLLSRDLSQESNFRIWCKDLGMGIYLLPDYYNNEKLKEPYCSPVDRRSNKLWDIHAVDFCLWEKWNEIK